MKSENKRIYPRANTLLPFTVRRLTSEGDEHIKCRISTGNLIIEDKSPPDVEDERVNAWLHMLNAKLDYLISLESSRQEVGSYVAFQPLNISGSGMMMISHDGFQVGSTLEIRIILQAYPAKILHLFGEVVRTEKAPNRPSLFAVGIKFLNMSEEVRKELLKFRLDKHKKGLFLHEKSRS